MGTAIISIDAELAWGFHDMTDVPTSRVATARRGWKQLLQLLEEYRVPATWGVVGHLLLEQCDGIHANHPAPEGWFDRDPGGSAHQNPAWFGRDLVGAVRSSEVEHEIASHTFSHVELGHPDTTQEVATAELAAFRRVAENTDLPLRSFIFPRNSVGYRELVADHGYCCYRGRRPDRPFDDSSARSLVKAAAYIGNRSPPPVVEPSVDEFGLVNIPASLYLFSFEGTVRRALRAVGDDPIVRQAKHGLMAAIEHDDIVHLWLHPNNVTDGFDLRRLEAVLEYIHRQRNQELLTVETMGEVADRVCSSGRPDTRSVDSKSDE